jgi:hypothetical protein
VYGTEDQDRVMTTALLTNGVVRLTEIEALDLMCVDPAHQYRGAGTLLMEWGINVADKLGVEVCETLKRIISY